MPVFLWFVSFAAKRNEHLKESLLTFFQESLKLLFQESGIKKAKIKTLKEKYKKENPYAAASNTVTQRFEIA
ncbi:hypothetical protein [Phascolarctobacterium sp.]